jgi:hypothetical protein
MKHIWKVEVHFKEDIEGLSLEDWRSFNVIAADDVEARKKGIKLAKKECNKSFLVQYVELEHVLDIDG